MTLSALMSIGIKTMAASYAQLQATGHNIANANVHGYSRQSAELATAKGQFTGAGFFGRGVDVVTVSRAHNDFLAREADAAGSVASRDNSRLDQLKQLEQVFRTGEEGLGHAAGQFLNSMVDLASSPGDAATREVVLARAGELATRAAHAGEQLDTLQRGVSADMASQVAQANSLARNIADVNGKIAAVLGLGQAPNDLLDERDRLVSQLNAIVQVTTIPAEDGSLSVFVGGGQRLVLGKQAETLKLLTDETDAARSAIGFNDGTSDHQVGEETLGGGTIAGLLRFQNHDLVAGRNRVGQIAVALAGATNAQQLLGVNLYAPPGSVPAEPFFNVGDPRAVPAKANLKDGLGNFLSSVALTVTDPSKVQASEYSLRTDPLSTPGVYQVTRLADGKVSNVMSGDVLDGFRIDVGTPAPGPTDRFLLQPVARGANGMRLLLDDPRDISAAAPLIATAIPVTSGTVNVDSMRMLSVPPFPADSVRITFTSNAGDYSWDLLDSNNNVLSSATGVWQPGGTIPTPPTDMNGFQLTLSGVPRTGDIFRVDPADPLQISHNNGNALALAGLRDAPIVDGAGVTDAYAAAMSDIGVRVQAGTTVADISQAMADQAESVRTSDSGVNLDEEAARLIQYQQSYQAAAKVLQVAQSVFDTLLSTAAR